jgi:hypothetical protein
MFDYYSACVVSDLWVYNGRGFTVLECSTSNSDVSLRFLVAYNTYVSSRPLKSVNSWNRSPFWNALSREFRCRWCRLSCKLRPEIDNGFTFTLIKTTMRFKQIRKYIYRFWCQNGAILLLTFWLNNQSQIFPEKHSP